MRNPFRKRWWLLCHLRTPDQWFAEYTRTGMPPMVTCFFKYMGPYETEQQAIEHIPAECGKERK